MAEASLSAFYGSAAMPTLRECLYRAEEYLRLAEDTDQAFAREALLELAAKLQSIAVQLELHAAGRK
jgi:hypothetical protein